MKTEPKADLDKNSKPEPKKDSKDKNEDIKKESNASKLEGAWIVKSAVDKGKNTGQGHHWQTGDHFPRKA